MSKCGRCNDPITTDDDLEFATCALCTKGFHFECSTLQESSWRTMGPTRRSEWTCTTCRSKPLTKDNKERRTTKSDVDKSKEGSGKKDEGVTTLIEKLSKKFTDMEKFINGKMTEFGESLTFYGDKMEEMSTTIKNIEMKTVLLEKRVETQETENKEMKTRMKHLEGLLQQRDQKDLADKIEISGFKGENVNENHFVQKVIQLAGIEDDVQFKVEKMTRETRDNKGKNLTLVVQFKSEAVRNDVLSKVKKNKVYEKADELITYGSGVKPKFFFNECLTPYYKKLLFEARKLKNDKHYEYLWVQSGKILLRKNKDSRIEALLSMDDLGKM
uniref:PHD-type domain-containing protein n=1 Tax=Cacopsylla melanoneura TaxID=428564 RepID=A0A8D8QNQ0_9HEMI